MSTIAREEKSFDSLRRKPLRAASNLLESVVTSKLERHAEQLSALGHPTRLAIVRFLVQGGAEGTAAGEIQTHVDLPASTLSHHLKRLADAGLITSRSEGTFHYYRPEFSTIRALTDYLWEDCCKRGQSKRC